MTIFTIDTETGERIQRTHDDWMNWAPYPAPDGRHYVFVRPLLDNPLNWEIFLGDLEGGEPVRLTFNDSFDGFPSISPDGTKMLFARSEGPGFHGGTVHVCDGHLIAEHRSEARSSSPSRYVGIAHDQTYAMRPILRESDARFSCGRLLRFRRSRRIGAAGAEPGGPS